jgi:hypothetical protein
MFLYTVAMKLSEQLHSWLFASYVYLYFWVEWVTRIEHWKKVVEGVKDPMKSPHEDARCACCQFHSACCIDHSAEYKAVQSTIKMAKKDSGYSPKKVCNWEIVMDLLAPHCLFSFLPMKIILILWRAASNAVDTASTVPAAYRIDVSVVSFHERISL